MDGNCELVLGLALCLQHSQPARQQESLCPESAGQEVHVLQLQAPAGGLKTLPSKHGCSSAEAGCPCQETEQMAFVQGTPLRHMQCHGIYGTTPRTPATCNPRDRKPLRDKLPYQRKQQSCGNTRPSSSNSSSDSSTCSARRRFFAARAVPATGKGHANSSSWSSTAGGSSTNVCAATTLPGAAPHLGLFLGPLVSTGGDFRAGTDGPGAAPHLGCF